MDRRTFLGSVPVSASVVKLSRLAQAANAPAPASSPYAEAAKKYAEALLEHGRDHYGPAHTPLFVQMIDLRTLEVPRQRTAAEWRAEMAGWKEDSNYLMWGKDRSSVLWAQDSNLLWDTENIRLMYALSEETGDARYAAAADNYIHYFLKHCVSRTTGFFAWGEHIAYNVVDDEIHGQRHELQHAAPLWPELWKFDPDAVRNEIEAIYQYHITDKRSMAYDRHANHWNGLPERDQATIMGYAGIYIDAFAFLFEMTQDAKYTEWARKLVLAFQSKSNAQGLYPDNWTDRQKREEPLQFPARPGLAWAMYTAFQHTKDPRWRDDANRYLEACVQSFRTGEATGDNLVLGSEAVTFSDTALLGYQLTGSRAYFEMAEQAGAEVLRSQQPHAQMASTLANSINSLRHLYEISGEPRWLEGARKLGDFALQNFVHSSGLIPGTAVVDRPPYYDSIQGSGALALALYRLGKVKESATSAALIRLEGVATPPQISDLQFAPLASNSERIAVTARIASASGIQRATLQYAYGNEVGFEDSQPEVNGDRYTFHINPPGKAFLGQVLFAVEAVDASPNANRAMSPWQKLRLASFAQALPTNRALNIQELGVELNDVEAEGRVGTYVTAGPPEGVAAPAQGWVSTGKYLCFASENLKAGAIVFGYAPEDAERLIEPTLTLAYWSGTEWQRVPSKLDREARRVSAAIHPARFWTLVGEDRVLWRAPGRQGGTALADLNHDGKFEVVTALWQPGEMLSSTGKAIRQFPIDNPTHPVLNASPPVVAQLVAGEEPLLLFGAPAGYVYAYDPSGKLHWRAEVGGEIFGGVAVGRLTGGPESTVVASWNGGAAAIDSAGRKLWQKAVPTPSGSTPVLVDLDGDQKLEIILNAGSGILALKGDTGAVLWEYSVPRAHFVTPAVGELVRKGKPRIITGDQSETVCALDEAGKLLWRQDQLYGPFEVPEWIEQYEETCEIGLANLEGRGERQIVVSMKSGDTVALSAWGERLWRFSSHERKVGTSLTRGGHLGFADLDNDGKLEVIVSQQDSYLYVLDSRGRPQWVYRGYFWYHSSPSIADLENSGELNIVFTAPEENGTYALRSGSKGSPGRAPWPMDRGGPTRTNCAPW
jgi:outer membrane protein assembly factor BamB